MIASLTTALFAQSASPAATFPGSGFGPIPDGAAGGTVCGDYGAPLDITFNVTGITAPISDVKVNLTGTHTWITDLEVTLIAPGGAPTATIFKGVQATTATACGDNSDLGGPYSFFDAAPASPTFWDAAVTAGSTTPLAAGNYRATAPLTGAVTTITPIFAGLTTGQVNGTWTLRVRDGGEGDEGSITAASLEITAGAAPTNVQHVVDYNGDGRTDYSVVRNTGGGANGQTTWFNLLNGGGTQQAAFGLANDFFVPADYDGDSKTDLAVWRPGDPGAATWYILQSSNLTIRAEAFGQTGDDPTVVGDYNGDGKDDLAVYREGAAAGQQSVWYYRATPGGAVNFVPWGLNGDFPAPGDYDGDGKNDFSVQRDGGSGQAVFITYLTGTGTTTYTAFGTPTDVIVPGDYDGDGKTDYATARGSGGQIVWFYLPSSGGSYVTTIFGVAATDFPVQGDYDGDGKTDQAVWRPNLDPTQNYFYVNRSNGSGLQVVEWGQNGDYPVANYNVH